MNESPRDIDELDFEELKLLLVHALEEIAGLKRENAALREEVARLKGLKGKPDIKPSGMEKNARPRSSKKGGGKKSRYRGSKNNKLRIDDTKVLKPDNLPDGSKLKGYEDYLVLDLILRPWTVLYRRQRWKTPDGRTIVAKLPDGISGHFGSGLIRFVLSQYHKCRVTLPLISGQLHDLGMLISERHVMRLLIKDKQPFLDESSGILRAGLETAGWITTDDTGARHKACNNYCTHIGNDHFTWFKTTQSKSRLNFLELLRAGDKGYQINDGALDYMRDRNLPDNLIKLLAEHKTLVFANFKAWKAHLKKLRFNKLKIHPDPVRIASEGALWGRITALGLLKGTIIVSDGAGQFRVGDHALCWVHGERLVYKLDTFCEHQRRAKQRIRHRIWWLYADIKQYCHDPTLKRKHQLRRRFDSIFTTKTEFVTLDRLLKRLHRRRHEFLAVLERPDIPMHTNGSENDIRCQVTKRKISGGTRSDEGRDCRDAFLSIMKTCAKLEVSFWDYLGDRLSHPGANKIPLLPDVIRQQASA
ncbi:MAG: transposase [Planctomycetaceae bacterium]|nr:transposase [Planctomycetaceae bacterium]